MKKPNKATAHKCRNFRYCQRETQESEVNAWLREVHARLFRLEQRLADIMGDPEQRSALEEKLREAGLREK